MPELTSDLVEFLRGGVSILAASRDAELRPWISRALALAVAPDRRTVTAYLADRAARSLIEQLAPGAPFAVTASRVATLRTVQVKGVVTEVRAAREEERPAIEAQAGGFAESLSVVGYPLGVVRSLATWPATAVELRVEGVFEQTPGPGAGQPVKLS